MATRTRWAATFWFFVCSIFSQNIVLATTIQGSPENSVRDFYAWYITKQSSLGYPVMNTQIYDYVAKDTVTKLRRDYFRYEIPTGIDYFTKIQGYYSEDWMHNTVIGHALMLNGIAIVPVTFGSPDKISILVFLINQDGAWKIIKVDDTLEYK